MRAVVCGLVALLIILHQDFWWGGDSRLVLGVVPIGFFYHLCISVGASLIWALACWYCWPADVDVPDEPLASAPPARSRGR